MMSLGIENIEKIAQLARLDVSAEKASHLQKDLNKILELVKQMNTANTENVQPLAHPCDETQPLRDDVITETDQREDFQSLAPQVSENLYLVPEVISSE